VFGLVLSLLYEKATGKVEWIDIMVQLLGS
jgi:hypothetical protein